MQQIRHLAVYHQFGHIDLFTEQALKDDRSTDKYSAFVFHKKAQEGNFQERYIKDAFVKLKWRSTENIIIFFIPPFSLHVS